MKPNQPVKNKQQKPGKKRPRKGPWIFLAATGLLYLLTALFNSGKAQEAGERFIHLVLEIAPLLLVVFVLMTLINLFLKTEILLKYMGKDSGIKGWIISILTGILSIGAIYMWFPILKTLMDKGVKPGLIAVFLYNRGIKLNWLPLMMLYFGMKYVIVLTLVTVLVSVLQGIILDFFLKPGKDAVSA
ncbi:permease [Candidatus Sulfidibacterium hydrothermale]|uniref:permease n=1 Tax=Candidatus Sulfidibacterium hydrothermale TaxID=2875962 RepID=UPI001F0AD2E1|nr:permease [Candidatus Sulfidibacterium hydrothermale]UBM63105.1 permease [Candidatus Sulfidibacterium hydrothermale]